MIAKFTTNKGKLPYLSIEVESEEERKQLRKIVKKGNRKAKIKTVWFSGLKPKVNSIDIIFKKGKK